MLSCLIYDIYKSLKIFVLNGKLNKRPNLIDRDGTSFTIPQQVEVIVNVSRFKNMVHDQEVGQWSFKGKNTHRQPT